MNAYPDATRALSTLLGDEAPLNFTWRRTDTVPISAFTVPNKLRRILGRTIAETVLGKDGKLLARAGTVVDDRTTIVIAGAAIPEIQLTPQPSFLVVEHSDAIGASAAAIAGLTSLDIHVHTQAVASTGQDTAQGRALVAESIRSEWTDAIIAPDIPIMNEVFPDLPEWHLATPSQLTIRCGMETLAGWQLPVVLLPPTAFHAWIAMRNVVIPAIEEVLDLPSSAESTLLQLEEYIDVRSTETTVLPIDIRRGFARPLAPDKSWNLADGYAVLLPDQTYEAGTPIEVWIPGSAN